LPDALSRSPAEPIAQRFIREKPEYGGGKSFRSAIRDGESGLLIFDQFGDARHSRSDDRDSHGHDFEE
jgi:hypothetical protein